MREIVLMLCLFMGGCTYKFMTNDEIIVEEKKCEAAGMFPEAITRGYDFKTVDVICRTRAKR